MNMPIIIFIVVILCVVLVAGFFSIKFFNSEGLKWKTFSITIYTDDVAGTIKTISTLAVKYGGSLVSDSGPSVYRGGEDVYTTAKAYQKVSYDFAAKQGDLFIKDIKNFGQEAPRRIINESSYETGVDSREKSKTTATIRVEEN